MGKNKKYACKKHGGIPDGIHNPKCVACGQATIAQRIIDSSEEDYLDIKWELRLLPAKKKIKGTVTLSNDCGSVSLDVDKAYDEMDQILVELTDKSKGILWSVGDFMDDKTSDK